MNIKNIEIKVIGEHKAIINLLFKEAIMIKEISPALNLQIDFHVLDQSILATPYYFITCYCMRFFLHPFIAF